MSRYLQFVFWVTVSPYHLFQTDCKPILVKLLPVLVSLSHPDLPFSLLYSHLPRSRILEFIPVGKSFVNGAMTHPCGTPNATNPSPEVSLLTLTFYSRFFLKNCQYSFQQTFEARFKDSSNRISLETDLNHTTFTRESSSKSVLLCKEYLSVSRIYGVISRSIILHTTKVKTNRSIISYARCIARFQNRYNNPRFQICFSVLQY